MSITYTHVNKSDDQEVWGFTQTTPQYGNPHETEPSR
jgi:hypothetical protein